MRRPRLRLALAVAVTTLAVTVAACSVPGRSAVIIDGQQTAQPSGLDNPPAGPVGPAGITDPMKLIDAYLDAAAGSSVDAARQSVLPFMTSDAQRHWVPTTKITVVRRVRAPTPSNSPEAYTVEVEVIGLFDPATGTVEPPLPGPTDVKLTFVVHSLEPLKSQLRLDELPDGLFMTEDTGLLRYYAAHTVYFWDANRTRLIAELRYLPRAGSEAQQEARIVNWILSGASAEMESVVSPPPRGVTLRDPTVATINNRIVINLSTGAHDVDPTALRQLVEQIGWSFGPGLLTHPIELEIDDQPKFTMDPALADAAAFQTANLSALRGPTGVAFAVSDGVVRLLANPYAVVPGSVLTSRLNTSVLVAAISSDQRYAAYVKPAPGGREALWIAGVDDLNPGAPVLTAASIKFPAWVMGPPQAPPRGPPGLAVLVDGALMLVGGGSSSQPCPGSPRPACQTLRPATPSTSLTSFAVSPEGSRVAMTVDGRLLTAAIQTQAGRSTLVPPRELTVDPVTVNVVAWRSETELVVGARDADGLASVAQVYTDGTNYDKIGPDLGTLAITHLAAYSSVEITSVATINPILVQAGTTAFEIISGQSPNLTWSPGSDTVPTQTASPGKTHKPAEPFNPFFAE